MSSLLLALASIFILTSASTSFAQDVGISEIIYQEDTAEQVSAIITTLPNNISFELIKKHLTLAKILGSASPTDDALDTIKNLEDLLKTDILQALSMTDDKRTTLTNYLTACDQYLEKWNSAIISIKQELALIKLEMNACQVDKESADRGYFQWIDAYDDQSSQQALTQSIENEKCVTEKRIQYNAKVYLLDKLAFFQSLLKQRYDIIYDEQDIIIDHFEVISDKLIEKLNAINEVLKTYQF